MTNFKHRHIRTIHPGQPGYSEPLGREQAEVYQDGKRYIYDLGDHTNGGLDKSLKPTFRLWLKQVFSDNSMNSGRKITGRFPSYWIDA